MTAARPGSTLNGSSKHGCGTSRSPRGNVPNNSFPGGEVFVNGKNFDALQLATRTLWEVKTDNFDMFPPELREIACTGPCGTPIPGQVEH